MLLQVDGVRLSGICTAVPGHVLSADEVPGFSERDLHRAVKSTGFEQFRIASDDKTTADYCASAAERLLKRLEMPADSVDALVFVSQTPDYVLPPTSAVLQCRLKLRQDVAVFDLNYGCTGFVYGLYQAAMLVKSGMKRVLLCVGDTPSKLLNPLDRSARMIFGDAAAAAVVEAGTGMMPFSFYTDGSGAQSLCIPAGAYREPCTAELLQPHADEQGNVRSACQLFMNGADIMTFSLAVVPKLLHDFLSALDMEPEQVDLFALHQANRLILRTIARKMKLPEERVPFAAAKFGNTSGASIPLLLSCLFGQQQQMAYAGKSAVLCGFGVGLAAAVTYVSFENTLIMGYDEI